MKIEFCLISALPLFLASCATSDLPELPSVIAQPQSTAQGELSELPQLPETRQASTPSRATELPSIPALPQATVLPRVPNLPPASSELPQVSERSLPPTPVNNNPQFTEIPQVEILAETTEQTELVAEPVATTVEQTQPGELTQEIDTVTEAQTPAPVLTSQDDTRINIEFTYDEPAAESSGNIPFASIADDLASVLAYIPSIDPTRSSIRISTPGSEFDNVVKDSMQKLGYSFAKGSSHTRRQHLTTSFSQTNRDQQRSELTAIISIDGTLIKRIYVMQNNTISPASRYTVHGIDAQLVLPSDQINVL